MTDVAEPPAKRKVLSLRKEKHPRHMAHTPPRFLREEISVYMVWSPDSEMPKRVYTAEEQSIAMSHAKSLTRQTGQRFYVMRSWRGYDPE